MAMTIPPKRRNPNNLCPLPHMEKDSHNKPSDILRLLYPLVTHMDPKESCLGVSTTWLPTPICHINSMFFNEPSMSDKMLFSFPMLLLMLLF